MTAKLVRQPVKRLNPFITVKVTPEQYERMKHAAQVANRNTVDGWAREVIFTALECDEETMRDQP